MRSESGQTEKMISALSVGLPLRECRSSREPRVKGGGRAPPQACAAVLRRRGGGGPSREPELRSARQEGGRVEAVCLLADYNVEGKRPLEGRRPGSLSSFMDSMLESILDDNDIEGYEHRFGGKLVTFYSRGCSSLPGEIDLTFRWRSLDRDSARKNGFEVGKISFGFFQIGN